MYEKEREQLLLLAKMMRKRNREAKVSGERFDIPLSGRQINVVWYGAGREGAPLILGFHGGGYLLGGNALNDAMWCAVRDALGVNVASVEYRKSPEFSSLDAIMDGYEVVHWFYEHAETYRIDREQISVMGCSAGANLAAGLCILASRKKERFLKKQILIYPVVDNVTDPKVKNGSCDCAPEDYIFRELQCTPEQAKTSLASPLLAGPEELAGVPSAAICVAEKDYLKHEGKAYAEKLTEAGVEASLMECEGMPHIFFEVGFGEIPEPERKSYSKEMQELILNGRAHEVSVEVLQFIKEHL